MCVHCRPSGSTTPPQAVLDLMSALYDGDWDIAEASQQSHRNQASGLVAAHLQWHLERQLRTLPLVERVYRVDRAVADHRVSLFGQDVTRGDETGGQDPLPRCLRRLTTIRPFPTSRAGRSSFRSCHTHQRQVRPPAPAHLEGRRPKIPADQVPRHVAVVMDGNGRWASQRGLHRTEGHKMGEAVLIDITCGAIELGIKHLTVYAFSTENWKRSTEEVRFLMGFNREVVRRRRENLNDMGVRMRWVGSRPRMWRSVIKEFDIAEQMTVGNDVITINYCVNYGGRTEIVAAGRLNASRISEATFAKHLHRADIPDVDLFIRTSGEQRASNFLLWQAAYAEYVFQDKLWPDYDRRDLWEACEENVSRNRRFGRE